MNINIPPSDAQKEKLVNEVKEVVRLVHKSCELSNSDMLTGTYLNSSDFVALVGSQMEDYKQSLKNAKDYFATVSGQKVTLIREKYTVLGPTVVLYTATSKWETYYKNDSTVISEPWGMQFIFKKTNDRWKLVSWTEYGEKKRLNAGK